MLFFTSIHSLFYCVWINLIALILSFKSTLKILKLINQFYNLLVEKKLDLIMAQYSGLTNLIKSNY